LASGQGLENLTTLLPKASTTNTAHRILNGQPIKMRQVKCSKVDQDVVQCYPWVFDWLIRVMEEETFHITLREDAITFGVKTPRSTPFAYRDKLKAELD